MKKNVQGFTLLELLIYTGIFGIVGTLFAGVLLNTLRIQTREGSAAEVGQQAQFVIQRVQQLVRSSSLIEMAANSTSTMLRLRMEDPTKDPTYVFASGTMVGMWEGTNASTTLTNARVVLQGLVFSKYSNSPGNDTVKVDFSLAYASSSNPRLIFANTFRTAISRVSAAVFDSNVIPGTSNAYDVGANTNNWKNSFFSGDMTIAAGGRICLNGTCQSAWPASQWTTSGNNIYNSNTGNVGIGTVSPAYPLHIKTTGTDATIELNNTGSVASDWAIQSASGVAMGGTAGASFGIYSFTGTAYRLVIDGSGKVGLGTQSPAAKLDVEGSAYIYNGTITSALNCGDFPVGTSWYQINGGCSTYMNDPGGLAYNGCMVKTERYIQPYATMTYGCLQTLLGSYSNGDTDIWMRAWRANNTGWHSWLHMHNG